MQKYSFRGFQYKKGLMKATITSSISHLNDNDSWMYINANAYHFSATFVGINGTSYDCILQFSVTEGNLTTSSAQANNKMTSYIAKSNGPNDVC